MNIGYPDTKNRQGGVHSPLLKKRSWAGRTWRKAVGKIGDAVRGVRKVARKTGSDIKTAFNEGE